MELVSHLLGSSSSVEVVADVSVYEYVSVMGVSLSSVGILIEVSFCTRVVGVSLFDWQGSVVGCFVSIGASGVLLCVAILTHS